MQVRNRLGRDRWDRWDRWVAVAVAGVVIFGVLLLEVRSSSWLPELDGTVARGLHRPMRAHPVLVGLSDAVSLMLAPAVLRIAAGIAAVVLLLRDRYVAAGVAALGVIGSVAATEVAKALVHRPRPAFADPVAHAAGWSFPSGHALAAGAAVTALIALVSAAVRRRVAAVAVALGAVVCASRLTLGVHYLSDVLAGAALGAGWVATWCAVLLAVLGRSGPRSLRSLGPSGRPPSTAGGRR